MQFSVQFGEFNISYQISVHIAQAICLTKISTSYANEIRADKGKMKITHIELTFNPLK